MIIEKAKTFRNSFSFKRLNGNYVKLALFIMLTTFLFASLASATTYYSDYGSSQPHNITTTSGSHSLQVDGMWGVDRWTEWYVNGSYTGASENDHTYLFNSYKDPEYTRSFSSGTVGIKALVSCQLSRVG